MGSFKPGIKTLSLGYFILICPLLNGLNIIFDLGEVLIKTDTLMALRHMGFSPIAHHLLNNPHKLLNVSTFLQYECLFRFLNKVAPRLPDQVDARDQHGILLPRIMCEWLDGTTSNRQTRELLLIALDEHPEYCRSQSEREMIRAMITMMFTPEIYVTTRKLIPSMADFVKECKAQGHQLFVLSNWDRESFELFKQMHPAFFDQFDGIVLSGEVGSLKPDPAPYNHLLHTHKLLPQDSIFFDDRIENIKTAKALNMGGCVVTKKQTYQCPLKSDIDVDALRNYLAQKNVSAAAPAA
ncbi:MAG TPA: HAD-IA family hydrolase [Candidatus Babeliales bacterium]|nr:HAD-IA family hydrolase [Candidatus Babeliales bacterium]